jgi:orotidine-5'-phosphate decarboxylase
MEPRVIVALDVSDAASALALCERLSPRLCRLKIGKELYTAAGPALVETLAGRGFGIFLDLKFHDIPNTVAQACKAAARLGVWMIDVHALGGRDMMQAARDALEAASPRPKLIAVTVLTSLSADDLLEVGIVGDPGEVALRLAKLARGAGLDGVVCSAQEAAAIRQACGEAFLRVTPGIRLAQSGADDQKRIMTPQHAIEAGASYLVVGRPITRAPDPRAALDRICEDIAGAERAR